MHLLNKYNEDEIQNEQSPYTCNGVISPSVIQIKANQI